ncbi:MAG: hypothetical protein ACI4WG_00570 [Erysipelotrichaceae bacterium]
MTKLNFKKIDITPKIKVMQAGYVQRTHEFEAVHDPLEAYVMVLEIDDGKICFVMTDFIGIHKQFKTDIIQQCQLKGLNIAMDDLIIGGSHNHSSASITLNSDRPLMDSKKPYVDAMVELFSDTIVEVYQGPFTEVETSYSSMIVDGIYSNRNDMDKLSDKVVHILKFASQEKTELLLMNMACHNTVLGPLNYQITAELFGFTRRNLQEKFGCEVCITQGNAGDMGNRQYRTGQDFGDLQLAADHLANQIYRKHSDFVKINLAKVRHQSVKYLAKFTLDASIYDSKIARYEKMLETETDLTQRKVMLSGIAGFKRKQALGSGYREFEMTAELYQLGDLVLVTIPGELGSILGLQIKNQLSKGKKVILWGYSNDNDLGYMVDREAYQLECQETNVTKWPMGVPEEYVNAIIKQAEEFII